MRKLYVGLALCAVACAPQHTLFKNGSSDYRIVLEEGASAVEQYAAQELQAWVREVSGAELPIVAEAASGKDYCSDRLCKKSYRWICFRTWTYLGESTRNSSTQ